MFHFFSHDSTNTIGDGAAAGLGGTLAFILSIQFLHFAQEGFYAFCFGILGAAGGYLANKAIKWLEKKLKK